MVKFSTKKIVLALTLIISEMVIIYYIKRNEVIKYYYIQNYDILALILFISKLLEFLLLPINIFFVVGTLIANDDSKSHVLLNRRRLGFKMCFRIVTRGDFPDLVHSNVKSLIALLEANAIDEFLIQVVCNKSIGLTRVVKHKKVRELEVPADYTTRNGTMFKARNLQYALEKGSGELSHSDWLIHLDEDTQVTQSSIAGIVAFILDGKHHIGNTILLLSKIDHIKSTTQELLNLHF